MTPPLPISFLSSPLPLFGCPRLNPESSMLSACSIPEMYPQPLGQYLCFWYMCANEGAILKKRGDARGKESTVYLEPGTMLSAL